MVNGAFKEEDYSRQERGEMHMYDDVGDARR
jgi:hypothetical protein